VKVLVTGAAGFIGMHVAERLLADGIDVFGLDNLNSYYDVRLKEARLARLRSHRNFRFERCDLADDPAIARLFGTERFDRVVHLAAQAGVRYSLSHPQVYVDSNVRGTVNVLQGCRAIGCAHLVFASTSSVYGLNATLPSSPHHGVDHPVSLYASTKRAGELLCHNYAHLFGLPVTALRFFMVYGPWGRPDMSPMLFAERMLKGAPIDLFNAGRHRRDFTFVDDIVDGVVRVLGAPPAGDAAWDATTADPASSRAPFRIFNLGNGSPVELSRFIELLEQALGVVALRRPLPMQAGDVEDTHADIGDLQAAVGYRPLTPVEEGVRRFVEWYLAFDGPRECLSYTNRPDSPGMP
jgi:UDP-glucuronate 4-epimerase